MDELKESIQWFESSVEVPTDNRNVLLFNRVDVWIGYWDAEDETWRFENGQEIVEPKYWAEMPKGPEVTT